MIGHPEYTPIPKDSGDFGRKETELWQYNRHLITEQVFGLDLAEKLLRAPGGPAAQRLDLRAAAAQVESGRDLSDIATDIQDSRQKLVAALTRSELWSASSAFLPDIFKNPEYRAKFRPYFPEGTEYDQLELPKRMSQLQDRVYVELLFAHVEAFGQKSMEFSAEQEPRLKAVFWNNLKRAVEAGRLSVDLRSARIKLGRVAMHLQDLLAKPLPELYGFYDQQLGRLYMAEQSTEALSQNVSSHELTHVLQGVTPALYNRAPKRTTPLAAQASAEHPLGGVWVTREGPLSATRSGLSVYSAELNRWQYTWLSEAEAEVVSRIIRQSKEPSLGYIPEMELRAKLLTSGLTVIPDQLMHSAFFEDFESSSQKPDAKLIDLFERFEASYAPGFLDDVDAAMRHMNTREVIKLLETDWRMMRNASPRR